MAGNIRNKRTAHPKKAARRERAAERLMVKPSRKADGVYMGAKLQEAAALGFALV